MKKSLVETNPYLRDPEKRAAMLARSVYESSVFEGARGVSLAKLIEFAHETEARISRKNEDKAS